MTNWLERLGEELESISDPSPMLVKAFEMMAKSLYDHRLANHGYTPSAIYVPALGIGGTNAAVEIVVRVIEDGQTSYFLKLRDSKTESGWGGLYHIPGTAFRLTDTGQEILDRLSLEIWGKPDLISWRDLERVGEAVIYDEAPNRLDISPTLIYLLTIAKSQVELLYGEWRAFTDFYDPSVIGFQRGTLKWVARGPTRPPMVRF